MGMIRIYERSSKKKRQPGWQQKQVEHDAWLAKVNSMSTGFARTPAPRKSTVRETTPSTTVSTFLPKSFEAFKGGGTVRVARPELEYRDDPEMLKRELRARERKFNVAPAYNKGPTIYVSEDQITNQLLGGRRR